MVARAVTAPSRESIDSVRISDSNRLANRTGELLITRPTQTTSVLGRSNGE